MFRFKSIKLITAPLCVALVIFLAIASKSPNPACHCNDSKTQTKGSFCPFASLRLAAGTISVSAVMEIPEPVVVLENYIPTLRGIYEQKFFAASKARAPPTLLA